jgi:hypothetical protein
MRNLKDIIVERLVLSKNRKTKLPSIEEFNKACLDYIERVTRGYPEFKIEMYELQSYKDYTSIYDTDKLPYIDIDSKLTPFLKSSGPSYIQSIQYNEDVKTLPIRICYCSKRDVDVEKIKKLGLQIFRVDINLKQLFELLNENDLIELYEYITTAERK